MKKILFIIPPNITFNDFIFPSVRLKLQEKGDRLFGSLTTEMPLGIISLSAYIKKNMEVQTHLLDFNVLLNKLNDFTWDSFPDYFYEIAQSEINKFGPDVIGISALFSTAFKNLIDLGEISRTIQPDAFIIAGGNVATVSYRDIFVETGAFDAVCHGEGELPLLELLRSESMAEYIAYSPVWITKDKVNRRLTFEHTVINELDSIPFDYSLINTNDYELNPIIRSYSTLNSKGKAFNIMTSRGCPFKCIFCSSHKTHGREMRYHSLGRVKEDILKLKNDYDVKVITFMDDHFMGDKKRAYEIVKFISEIGITAFFPNSLALFALSREFLVALKEAGVEQLVLAVESGSEYVLKNIMKKPLKLDIVRRVAKDCREIGIYTDCNILIGLPGERKEDIEDTRKFLKTIGANWFRIAIATPHVGSEMHEICEEKNYFKGVVIEANFKKAIVETEDFDAQYIQDTTYDINIELNFVFNTDLMLGNYEVALMGFENVLHAKPNHPIALYYTSVCHERLGDAKTAAYYLDQAKKAYPMDPIWRKYVSIYSIPIADSGTVSV